MCLDRLYQLMEGIPAVFYQSRIIFPFAEVIGERGDVCHGRNTNKS